MMDTRIQDYTFVKYPQKLFTDSELDACKLKKILGAKRNLGRKADYDRRL